MAVISIVGTSGVGKSFLVKQLSSLLVAPAFFEGEEGTIPQWILDNIFSEGDPVQRYDWFLHHYKTMLEKARKISNAGLDCFVDGAVMSPEAILIAEGYHKHPELLHKVESIIHLRSDKTIVLIASKSKLKSLISARKRTSEPITKALERAWRVQQQFINLAKKEKGTIIIDRTNLDFAKSKDLQQILTKINQN